MRRVCPLALLLMISAFGGSRLYLKSRTIDTSDSAGSIQLKQVPTRADAPRRVHLIVQYDHRPTQQDFDLLAARGISVGSYVHENGLVITCDDPGQLEGLGLVWVSPMLAVDKISPALLEFDRAEPQVLVVEFHHDVDPNDCRQVVLDAGAELLQHPDLPQHHVLTRGSLEQIAALAVREEVAYIFPGASDLTSGSPIVACAGALTHEGRVGQYIAKIGEGWDGPGRGSATLGYVFGNTTERLPADAVRSEVVRAMNEWSRGASITFSPGTDGAALRTINILFASGAHDDAYVFDGQGGSLAHTFFPAPPNPEPIAGDMHFDADEPWRIGNDLDLYSVVLHELGHALGLGHSDVPGSVMYPYYSRATTLRAEDMAAIQELYAAPSVPEVPVDVPPTVPVNPSVPPNPTPAPVPAPEPLILNVQPPPATIVSESIVLLGSLSGGSAPVVITWQTNRGHNGALAGTSSWSAQIVLESGANQITITATDSRQISVSRVVNVERRLPATPVSIQVTAPSTASAFAVSHGVLILRGTASHSSGIVLVSWLNDRGGSGTATGTVSWDTGAIALRSGANTITIRAVGGDSSVGTRVIQVNYTVAATPDNVAPSLAITNPGSAVYRTSAGSIVLQGTAKDNVGVTEVVWFSSTGPAGRATGTASWVTPAIPLVRGYNSIVVRAFDAAGNAGWRTISVTRE